MKKHFILGLVLVAVLVSCEKNNNEDKGPASLRFRLTDAPGLYDKVNIDITGAEIIVNESTIYLDINAGIYNLLDFANGKDTVIFDQEVPSGNLSQIRLILGVNNTIKVGTKTYNLETPSAQQSGLKLNLHETILPGVSHEYFIDFDVARSILTTGGGKYKLKPVIKVFTLAVTGSIQGVISPAEAKPLIYAISAQTDTASVYSDPVTGNYMFRGLESGIYKLQFIPQSPYAEKTLQNIIVSSGNVTKVATVKL
jgi:hypothetical protein